MSLRSAPVVVLMLVVGVPAGAAKKRTVTDAPDWVQAAVAMAHPEGARVLAWLHIETQVEPLGEGGVRYTERRAGRALGPAALDDLGSEVIPYRRGDRIESFRSWTVAPDGSLTVAGDKDDAIDVPVIPEGSVFEDSRARVLHAAGGPIGSVFAYEWSVVRERDDGAAGFSFGDPDRHTVLSRFIVRVPAGWELATDAWRAGGIEERQEGGGVTWVGRDLPPLPREDLQPPAVDRLPLVWAHWRSADGARGFGDWNDVGLWYEKLSRPVLAEPGESAEIAQRLRPSSERQLVEAISGAYAFAARDVRYVSIQIGIGGFRPHSPAIVCSKRYGDCKDKAFLLRALLGAWGYETYPVLVRTADLGPLLVDVPTSGQFNHCIAAVRVPDDLQPDLWSVEEVDGLGRLLFLDATAREASPWALPTPDQGTRALVVHPEGGILVQLPVQPPEAASIRRQVYARLDAQGSLREGVLLESWSGTEATRIREYYAVKDESERQRDVLADLQGRFPGSDISDYQVEGLDDVSRPVSERTRLAGGRFGKRVGDLLIVEPGSKAYGLFRRVSLPPGARQWPLEVGLPREEVVEIQIDPPSGWVPEALPEALEIGSEHLRARSAWSREDGMVVYRRSVQLISGPVPPQDYPEFRAHLRAIQDADDRAVVFVPG